MEIEKYIAALLAGLMAASTFVGAALASDLSGFPSWLFTVTATASAPNYLVVVGEDAAPSDVVGAIDLASRLAEGSYTIETIPGVAAVTVQGKEIPVAFDSALSDAANFGTDPLTKTQVPFLLRESITYEDQSSYVLEEIRVPNAAIWHDTTLNGTVYLKLEGATSPYLTYTWKLTKPIKLAGTYDKLLKIKLFGTEFSILNITDADKIKVMTGVSGSIDATTPLTYGGYSFYSDLGATDGSWVRIRVLDSAGNPVAGTPIYVNKGATATITAINMDVTLTQAWVAADNTVLRADIIVGPKGKVLKEYTDGEVFPLNDYWTFDIAANSTSQELINITLKYSVINETNRYLKAGEKAIVPNDYFDLSFRELAVKDFATLTISGGKETIWSSDGTTKVSGEIPAMIITSTVPVFKAGTYSKAYIALNGTAATDKLIVAYYDESMAKALMEGAAIDPANGVNISIPGKYDRHSFTITYVNTSSNNAVNGTFTVDTADTNNIIVGFKFVGNEFILGEKKSEAESGDVGFSPAITGVDGIYPHKATLNWGTVVESIKENAAAGKVVISLPAEQQKAKVYVGKVTEVTAEAKTYQKVSPIKTAVAKLDTEVGDAEKAAYHLVLVGGPCKNDLVANLNVAGKFPYGCVDWPGENFALVQVIDDAFATGKIALVVAGTRAEDTRLATSILQNYDAYKAQFGTATKVKITGTIAAPSITPA